MRGLKLRRTKGYFAVICVMTSLVLLTLSWRLVHGPYDWQVPTPPRATGVRSSNVSLTRLTLPQINNGSGPASPRPPELLVGHTNLMDSTDRKLQVSNTNLMDSTDRKLYVSNTNLSQIKEAIQTYFSNNMFKILTANSAEAISKTRLSDVEVFHSKRTHFDKMFSKTGFTWNKRYPQTNSSVIKVNVPDAKQNDKTRHSVDKLAQNNHLSASVNVSRIADDRSLDRGRLENSLYDTNALDRKITEMVLNGPGTWVDPATDMETEVQDWPKSGRDLVAEQMGHPNWQNTVAGDIQATPRPEMCLNCFRVNFSVLLTQSDLCSQADDTNLTLLVLISSAPRNLEARNAIRDTWGTACRQPDSFIRCVFLLGVSGDPAVEESVRQESDRQRDIVQHDFADSYFNLTYKTMSALAWVASHCPKARYVMKTDDDMYVNSELLPTLLQATPNKEFFGGFCWGMGKPDRNTASKWYVSFQMYRKPYFPPICSGTGYILSMDLVYMVIRASANIPWFHLEDVYVALCVHSYGLVPHRILGFSNMAVQFDACRYRNAVLTSHQIPPRDLARYWSVIRQCPPIHVTPRELYIEVPFNGF